MAASLFPLAAHRYQVVGLDHSEPAPQRKYKSSRPGRGAATRLLGFRRPPLESGRIFAVIGANPPPVPTFRQEDTT